MLKRKHHDVRTTLSIDDDLASLLTQETRTEGISFRLAVNKYLRLGLMRAALPERKPFVVEPRNLGLPPGMSYDNIGQLLEDLEGPDHK